MRRLILVMLLLPALLLAADNPLEGDKFIEKANERFDVAVTTARQAYLKSAGEAYATKIKTYRAILAAATKAGEFERAAALKSRVDELETDAAAIDDALPSKKKYKPRPKNRIKLGTHEYALIESPAVWHLAEKNCEEMGGHLITIESPQERELAVRTAMSSKLQLWIGATDEAEEGRWLWVTGDAVDPQERQTWKLDNDYRAAHYINLLENGEFHDWMSGARLPYLCEWDSH